MRSYLLFARYPSVCVLVTVAAAVVVYMGRFA